MRKSLVPLLVGVLLVYSAQQMLTPLLAPLSRELLLTETQLGLVITVAAVALTVASPLWGRALDRWGVRAVLLGGLALATTGLLGLAIVAALGMHDGSGSIGPSGTFVLMLATRSVLFGAGVAAVPVAVLAAAATGSEGEAERTRAVGFVGAAQGLSLVLGPAAGGALAVVSLLLPLWLAPVLTALVAVWVLATIKRVTRDGAVPVPTGRRIRPWDGRILPLLGIGFLLYLSLSFVQVIIGFLVADRLHLDAQQTAGAVGIALFSTGLVLVGAQGALVPKLGWGPLRLVRVGVPGTIIGLAGLAVADQLWTITLALAVLALGLGLAMPGFSAGSTLVVAAEEQGTVAGLVTATIGLTFIVGPVAATALYEVNPVAPVLAGVLAAVAALVVVWTVPAVRRVTSSPATASTISGAATPGAATPGAGEPHP